MAAWWFVTFCLPMLRGRQPVSVRMVLAVELPVPDVSLARRTCTFPVKSSAFGAARGEDPFADGGETSCFVEDILEM